jgi:hypothetical protein
MREIGAADYLAGKSIDAFFAVDLPRHTESLRAAYEIGWRATRLDRPTKPSAQMQRVQAEKDAIAILQSAHEEMYLRMLSKMLPRCSEELHDAIALLWDARKHLQGQKLTMPGLYARKFFAAEERCCIRDGCGLRFDASEPETRAIETLRSFWQRYCPKHRTADEPNPPITVELSNESFDREPLPAKIEGRPMPKGVKLSRRELQAVFFVGREIALVNCLMGPTHQKRTVAEQKSFGYVMKTEDGRPSWLRFNAGDEIWMDNGKITILGAEGELEAQYQL